MYTEEELQEFYFPEEEEQEEQSFEDYEQEILDTCDYELIKLKLGEDIANALIEQ